MRATEIKSCYIGPEISPEHFVPEHFFVYVAKGMIHTYDGYKNYTLQSGAGCLVRKNRLARYNKEKEDGEFEKIVIIFDEAFLKNFSSKYKIPDPEPQTTEAFLQIGQNNSIDDFIHSLLPYYNRSGRIDGRFADIKREELLHLLLQVQPGLTNVLFDFGIPEKINIEAFMNRNYRFNVSIERFAYLTGRSVSSFKRDFKYTFSDTPNHWLVKKRLEEAHFLINKKLKKPTEIYLELGFENLSHFSFAFKKMFGHSPTVMATE